MKKWLPFVITFLTGMVAATGFYFWKNADVAELQHSVQPPAVGRTLGTSTLHASKKTASSKGPAKSELERISASLRPTRNGVRSIFERAGHIMDMDREQLEKLLVELEKTGRIRSPIAGISVMAAFARLAEIDPAGAMQRALQSKGELRDIAMFATMNEWLSRDRKGALAWFAQSEDDDAKRKYLTVATFAMGGGDPELITQLTGAISDPGSRRKAMIDALGALAFSDPAAAEKKLAEIEDPDDREAAGEKVYEAFLMRYPEKALDYAMAKPPGDKARENARQALVRWGDQDAGAALKWLGSQNKDVQKELFDSQEKGPGWGFGKATPEQITETALQLADQSQRDKLRAAYAHSQSWSDPSAGLSQLSSIKDPELQRTTASAIGANAARAGKTGEMTTWLESAIPNDTRDTVVASFATGLRNNPTAALEWAGKITNPTIRTETLNSLKAETTVRK